VSNDFSGKAMAAIEEITVCDGPSSHIEFQLFVKLTMPSLALSQHCQVLQN
jgi:hypothetical protein